MQQNIAQVLDKHQWMRTHGIWPNGKRYLWTDAIGVVNLLSLYKELDDNQFLEQAEQVVNDVYAVLGRPIGLRIGEQPNKDGQYFHYLAKWMFALNELSKIKPQYHEKVVQLVKQVHPYFLVPGAGVIWKMKEDLSGPYPGFGLGNLNPYAGYCTYKLIDHSALSSEIADMGQIVNRDFKKFHCTQDLGLGEMLWYCHFFQDEPWAQYNRAKCIQTLDAMWRDEGYFVRDPIWEPKSVFAYSNFGVSLGLQAQQMWPDRVKKINFFFENYKSNDAYDWDPITHTMHCTSYFPGLFLKNYRPSSPSSAPSSIAVDLTELTK